MEKRQWFRDAGFGIFVHWGIYSIPARGEWVMFQENFPKKEYAKLADQFTPKAFDAEELLLSAKRAGAKYMVFTTRHHDGFCMFDSVHSDFTSAKTAAKRDFVSEYVDACAKHDIGIGLYYSLVDWGHPGACGGPENNPEQWNEMVENSHMQVKELCSNYGKIDILWYDGDFFVDGRSTIQASAENWRAEELNAMVRSLQPSILINDRSGLPEDFDTPEQKTTASKDGRLWESCMTMNTHWGYCPADTDWKTSLRLVINLTACAATDGNFLLNIAPKADGTLQSESMERLNAIGDWLRRNGESVYGPVEETTPFDGGSTGMSVRKNGKVYLFVHFWPIGAGKLTLPNVKENFCSVQILSTGEKLHLERDGERLTIGGLPENPPDPLTTVIVLAGSEK